MRARIGFLLVFALWFGMLESARAQSSGSQLRVSIIALTDFDSGALQEKDLIDAIVQARDGLKSYFDNTLHVPPTILTTKEETTAENIRNWLFRDLAQDTGSDVHLIFVLTHGFPNKSPDPSSFKNEIFLATSDTDPTNYYGKAIRGAELIEAFRDIPKRAVVFLFLDSCGAGAIDGDNLQKILQHEPEFSSRLMILAASMPNEDAYRARFTKALLKTWQNPTPGCHSGRRQIESYLTDTIRSIPGTSQDVKQDVRLVTPLGQDFCIESFNYTERLAFVFNAAPDDVGLDFETADSTEPEHIDMRKDELAPLALRPKIYNLVARRSNQTVANPSQVETLDLITSPVVVKVLFSSDKLDEAEAQETAARYLDSRSLAGTRAVTLRSSANALRTEIGTEIVVEANKLNGALSEANQSLQIAEVGLSESEATIRTANAERDALLKGKSYAVFPPELVPQLNKIADKLSAAQQQYKTAVDQDQAARNKIEELHRNQSELYARKTRLDLLQYVAQNAESVRSLQQSTQQSIAKQLDGIFPGTQITNRGIVVPLPNRDELNSKYTTSYEELIGIANQNALRVELEFVTQKAKSISGQVKARKRVSAFLRHLQQLGLAATSGSRAGTRADSATKKTADSTFQAILSTK